MKGERFVVQESVGACSDRLDSLGDRRVWCWLSLVGSGYSVQIRYALADPVYGGWFDLASSGRHGCEIVL